MKSVTINGVTLTSQEIVKKALTGKETSAEWIFHVGDTAVICTFYYVPKDVPLRVKYPEDASAAMLEFEQGQKAIVEIDDEDLEPEEDEK